VQLLLAKAIFAAGMKLLGNFMDVGRVVKEWMKTKGKRQKSEGRRMNGRFAPTSPLK